MTPEVVAKGGREFDRRRLDGAGRVERSALLALSVIIAVAFGFHIGQLGHYADDWAFLAAMQPFAHQGLSHMAAALFRQNATLFPSRPLGLLFYPAIFEAFGTHPRGYQLLYLLFDIAVAWNFFALLSEENVPSEVALLASIFAALYPSHDATHHCNAATGTLALAVTLWAVRRFRSWQRRGDRRPLIAGLIALCVATLLYESAGLLPLLLIFLAYEDARSVGKTRYESAVDAARASAPPLVALSGIIAYQRMLVPRLLGSERHPVSFRPSHLFHVYLSGTECTILNRLTDKIYRSTLYAASHFGPTDWFWFAVSAGILIGICRQLSRKLARSQRKLALLGLGFFVLGYAPFVLDASYVPDMFDAVNRISLVPSLGGAALLAYFCAKIAKPSARALVTSMLACSFLMADLASNLQWADAYSKQQSILRSLDGPLSRQSQARSLLLFAGPTTIGSAAVFDSDFDFNGALAVRYGVHAPTGFAAEGRLVLGPDAAELIDSFGTKYVPYEGLYAYRYPSQDLSRIDSPATGARFLISTR